MSEESTALRTASLVIPLKKVYYGRRRIRAKRAIRIIRETVMRHFRKEGIKLVKISNEVNEYIWSRGIEKPPRKIKVVVEIREEEVEEEEGKQKVAYVLLPKSKKAKKVEEHQEAQG